MRYLLGCALLCEDGCDCLGPVLTTETSGRRDFPGSFFRPRILGHGRRDAYVSFVLFVLVLALILDALSNHLQMVLSDPFLLGLIVFGTTGLFVLFFEVLISLRRSVQTREDRPIGYRVIERPAKGARRSAKNRVAMVRNLCSNCGSELPIAGSVFCISCGASLQFASKGGVSRSEGRSVLLEDECMVCGLEMKPDDRLIWCPFCGNAAHREHLLAWLRLRQTCPICNRHISEAQLMKLAAKARAR